MDLKTNLEKLLMTTLEGILRIDAFNVIKTPFINDLEILCETIHDDVLKVIA